VRFWIASLVFALFALTTLKLRYFITAETQRGGEKTLKDGAVAPVTSWLGGEKRANGSA